MSKWIISLTLLCCSLGRLTGQVVYSKEVEEQIRKVEHNLFGRLVVDTPYTITERMAYYHVKGVSIAVVHDYKLVWAKGYGWADEKEKRPVTTETLFKPGSISKSLNAVGVLRLAQNGQLDLYADINHYLKSWEFPYDSLAKGKKITAANLLSHTGGLSVYGGFPGYAPESKVPTLPQVLDGRPPANTPAVRSLFEPGLKFQYSGGGTIISQLMMMDVTQLPYEKFMKDSVLQPLGMRHSFYSAAPPAGELLKKTATGYTTEGEAVMATFNTYPEQAPLGLWTTPGDLANYMTEIQLAYAGKSAKVLNPHMAQLHVTPYLDNSAAMGTFIGDRQDVRYFFHDAANEGYRGLFYGSLTGGDGVAILVNSDDGNIILELLNSVASVYHWKGFDPPVIVYTKKISAALAQSYVGLYIYEGTIAEVTGEKVGLHYWTQGQLCNMYFTSDKDFINLEFPSEKSFITGNDGHVTGFTRRTNGKEFPPATRVGKLDTLKLKAQQLEVFAWHLLENKRLKEAMLLLKYNGALQPGNVDALRYLAHCYLFKNDYSTALQLYRDYLGKKVEDPSSLAFKLNWDFNYFRKHGSDTGLIKKVSTELKL